MSAAPVSHLRPMEMLMALCGCFSFLVVAGSWAPLVLVLALVLAASWWVPWRYSTTAAQQRTLFSIIGLPFAAAGVFYISEGTVNAFAGVAVAGALYVLTGATVEVFREFGQARPGVFHAGVLMAVLVAGIDYRNPYYLYCVCLYGWGLMTLLRSPASGLNCPPPKPSRAPGAVSFVLFLLAAALSSMVFSSMAIAGRLFFRTFAGSDSNKGSHYLFAAHSDLSSVQDLSGSRQVAARVFGPPCLLRGQVLITYEGARWTAPSLRSDRDLLKPQGNRFELPGPPLEEGVSWRIQPIKVVAGPLPVPAGTWQLRASVDEIEVDAFDGIRADNAKIYQVLARGGPGEGRSRRRPRPGSPEWKAAYLQVPDSIREELAQEARRLLKPSQGPAEMAAHLEGYLSRGSYEPGAHHPRNRDPIVHFLHNGLKGHCEYFATSLALMLRTMEVPTRYVIGYRAQERNPFGNYLLVRDRDAHAWVEAYVDGRWRVYDPTPPAELQYTHPDGLSSRGLGALWDGLKMWASRWWPWLLSLNWGALLLLLLTPPAIWGLMRWLGSRGASADPRSAVERLGARAYARLARQGLVREPGETTLEFARRLPEPWAKWFTDYTEARFRKCGGEAAQRLEKRLSAL